MLERLRRSAADRLIARGTEAEREGRVQEACALYRLAVEGAPDYAKAHLNLGIGLEATGDLAGAARCHERALSLDPGDPNASYNLGRLRYVQGALPEASRLLRDALARRPDFPQARFILACVLNAQGASADAAAQFEALLQEQPDDFGALYHYAGVLRALGRLADAKAALRRALAIQPDNTEARAALSDVLDAAGELDAAAAELGQVLAARPQWADAHYNHGCVLRKLVRPQEAEAAFRRAIEHDPRHAPAYRMLSGVLLGQSRTAEALAVLRAGRAAVPGDFALESAELFALNSAPEADDDELFARHAAFGARLEQAVPARFTPHRNSRDPERRLRVGYVSGDFCYHVVTLFALPVLERHDRAACEVYCYSTGGAGDEYTRRVASSADGWRDAAALTPEALAAMIHDDAIDILVDLGGHSGLPQLGVFARQPAPVQATWLGYLNTTGLTRIQYRITDRIADPPGEAERRHTEALERLPHSQWCYRPFLQAAASATPPSARNGYVTFGSFNQALKLSPTTRALWARILGEAPGARLVVLGVPAGRASDALLADLTAAGASPERISIVPYVALQEYFCRLDAVDIALDATPYSGGTTTCDALWMGVPVITAPGSRPSSRSAASILATAGLGEWIVADAESYVRRALALARDPSPLAGLRASLRERLRASPLMDEAGFTRDLERAYRAMWRRWCAHG